MEGHTHNHSVYNKSVKMQHPTPTFSLTLSGLLPILLVFFLLSLPPVEGNPKPHSCATSHDEILIVIARSCKGKRSLGQPLVGQSWNLDLDETEVLQIMSNGIHLIEEGPSSQEIWNTVATEPKHKKKSKKNFRSRLRRRISVASIHQDMIDHDAVDPLASSSTSYPHPFDVDSKLWEWMAGDIEATSGGGRLRRDERRVLAFVAKCCYFGCNASDFPC